MRRLCSAGFPICLWSGGGCPELLLKLPAQRFLALLQRRTSRFRAHHLVSEAKIVGEQIGAGEQ
jgi:hypothetical protein